MKNFLRRYLSLIIALIIVSSVCCLFAGRKEGLFIDEAYTYGLSNSYYAPYVYDIKDKDMIDKVISHEELLDYMTVGEDDAFAFCSVYYNQSMDVHPPLYYWLFNFASSLHRGVMDFKAGLILNYVIYILTLVFLYKLAFILFNSRDIAVSAVVLYGLSVIGLSTMLMIRMYVLLTLETVLLAYFIALNMRERKTRYCIAAGITVFAGLMTQYYFVFYAFFVCLSYLIFALAKKDIRGTLVFSVSALLGVIALVVAFPPFIKQLTADALVSGGSAVENAKNTAMYMTRLSGFRADCTHRMKAIIFTALAFLALCIVFCKKIAVSAREGKLSFTSLIVIIPAFVTFAVVSIVSPVNELRYVYNIIPLFALAVCFLMYLADVSAGEFRKSRFIKKGVLLLVTALALWEARCLPPDYLYDEYSDYDALLKPHTGSPCVYFDNNYNSPLTYDMMQIMLFDEIFVTNDTASSAMLDYIGDADEMVTFIDISKDWASGYDSKEILDGLMQNTDFTTATQLYSNGFSDVYLLEK
ncbi:MAG: glycosyltransferase family 39 protein [Eubacteriales bacterium]|nr:glycosyltransferase family 39 protein [Eubacteriales bacterium]